MQHVLLLQGHNIGSINENLLNAIHDAVVRHPIEHKRIKVSHHLPNEFENNHLIICGSYPHLFHNGLTEEFLGNSGTLHTIIMNRIMLFGDTRFANNHPLRTLLFDQRQRHHLSHHMIIKFRGESKFKNKAIELIKNAVDFDDRLKKVQKYPDGEFAHKFIDKIMPYVRICAQNVP